MPIAVNIVSKTGHKLDIKQMKHRPSIVFPIHFSTLLSMVKVTKGTTIYEHEQKIDEHVQIDCCGNVYMENSI